jgi:hypothetical protein
MEDKTRAWHILQVAELSTRIGPGYPVLVLTASDSLPCHTPPPSTSDVTPLTQLHAYFPLVSTPPSCINRSRSTI